MRGVTVGIAVAVCVVSCGGAGPSGSTEPGAVTLHITTTGAGLVRGAGGDCRGSCSPTVTKGAKVRLEAVPDSGAIFSGWSGPCSGTSACELTPNADATIAATFAPQPPNSFRLSVTVQGQGRIVSSPPGIDCSAATCTGTFTDGTTVSLVATSAAGSKFAGWSGACGGADACSVTVRADAQVGAAFELLPVTVSANVSGPGQVTGAGMTCGNGGAACSAQVAPGTVVTLAAAAVPAARFMGWGGACSGNAATCQVTVQSDTSLNATFEYELQTLVANDGRNFTGLALNSSSVFFGRWSFEGNGIWTVPKKGGAPKLVASGIPYNIVADDSFVYWTDGSGIYSAPVEGGPASFLAGSYSIGRLALDEAGALYWIDPNGSGAVHRMQDRIDAVIASGQHENGGIAVDATDAYFTCGMWDGTDRAIRRVPKKGGSVETLVTPVPVPAPYLRVDSSNVYFEDFSSGVWVQSKSGGLPRRLSTLNGPGWATAEFDVNDFVVWWFWIGSPTNADGLFRANANGTGFTAVDTSADSAWAGPRVDDTAVYYFHAGALLRRLK